MLRHRTMRRLSWRRRGPSTANTAAAVLTGNREQVSHAAGVPLTAASGADVDTVEAGISHVQEGPTAYRTPFHASLEPPRRLWHAATGHDMHTRRGSNAETFGFEGRSVVVDVVGAETIAAATTFHRFGRSARRRSSSNAPERDRAIRPRLATACRRGLTARPSP